MVMEKLVGEIKEDVGAAKNRKAKFWTQYLAVISATAVSTVAGINFAWPSPSTPRLLAGELPYNITRPEASYIAITAPIGNIVGGPISAVLVDIIGRKNTLLLVALPQFLSFLFIHLSDMSLSLLYFARFLGGIGEGVNFTIMAMYIGEVAHPSIRGKLGSYISLTLRTGILSVNIIGSFFTIRTTSLIFMALPLIFVTTFMWMPETPYYLLMKNKPNQARKSLRFLRQKEDVEDELDKLTSDVKRQISESGTLLDLVRIETNRKALLIGIGLRTFQQFSGISAFSLYTQLLFKEALEDISPVTAAIVYSSVQLSLTFVSSIVVDRTGRKPLLIYSSIGCALALVTEAVFFTCRDFAGMDVSAIKWLPMVGMICFIIVFSLGMGTVVNVMLGELFSASVKAKGLGVLNVYFAITMSIATKFFQYMSDWKGLSIPFYVFSVWCVLGAVYFWKCVPETKGKTLEEIQQDMKGAKKSAKPKVSSETASFL